MLAGCEGFKCLYRESPAPVGLCLTVVFPGIAKVGRKPSSASAQASEWLWALVLLHPGALQSLL